MSELSHAVSECISCAVRGLPCSETKPSCEACDLAARTCSYDWQLDNPAIYEPFGSTGNFNQRIVPSTSFSVGGRFGVIYRAQVMGGDLVAIKRLFGDFHAIGATAFLMSLREAWKWSKLHHPNIVPLLGIVDLHEVRGDAFPQVCLVSPWKADGSIMEYIQHDPHADRLSLLLGVIEGVSYLHSQNPPIIHGGIRGDNILIDATGGLSKAMLRDIGHERIVQLYGAEYESQSAHRRRTAYRWLAFERVVPSKFGFPNWDASHTTFSDVFELMRAFLEVLSGNQPYYDIAQDYRIPQLLVRFTNPTRPPGTENEISDGMWELMQQAWSLQLDQRPLIAEIRKYVQSVHQ